VETQEFGARLRELRRQLGLTQRALAEKIDVDFSYLSKIESGAAPPPSEKVISGLAEVLNADKDELLTLAGKVPPDIAEALKNPEARQLLRSKRTQTIIRTSNKISGSIKMGSQNLVNYGSILKRSVLKNSLSFARIAIAVVLVVTVATSLWFASPARALTVDITNPSTGTLGSTYTFTTTITIEDSEVVPIKQVNLSIYKADNRATYEASATSLPRGTGSASYTNAQTGGGAISVTSTPTAGWISGYGYGYGSATWQSTAYSFFSPGGYGYGYGYGGAPTSITYSITWTPPTSWPTGNYQIEFVITANSTTFTTTSSTFSLSAPAAVAVAGAPGVLPPVTPKLSVTKVSDIVDSQGVFTQPATAKSEDAKVELYIEKGTTGKTKEDKLLTEISVVSRAVPPALPANTAIVGLAYDLGPEGATFDPPITITFTYDRADIPQGVNEEDLVLAYWGSEWVVLEGSVVDPATNTVTAPVRHFTTFTIMAYTAPVAFTSSGLTISPTEVNIGESVTISVTITNTGDLTGDYQAILKINGAVIATKKVTLAGDASQKLTFTTSKDAGGTYTVGLGGLSGTFTVKGPPVVVPPAPPVVPAPLPAPPAPLPAPPAPPTPAFNWWLIGGIIAGVIVVATITWILIRRREIS